MQCRDCGLVALIRAESGELAELPQSYRDSGELDQPGRRNHFRQGITCMVRAFDIWGETAHQSSESQDQAARRRLEALTKDRPCDKAEHWIQGLSPKEHYQKQQMDTIENLRQRMAAIESERADQRSADQSKAQIEAGKLSFRGAVWGAVAGGIVAGIIGLLQLAASGTFGRQDLPDVHVHPVLQLQPAQHANQ